MMVVVVMMVMTMVVMVMMMITPFDNTVGDVPGGTQITV